ncbi:AAA family ATPase [Shewanella sp. SP1S1-7]|uniref:AAA family ATPase n=1 Tax=Shewanella sp. SP1S1-7 TaxID=3063536 RepID=UPI00288DFE26|nr:AAA family ATPase [Shewanella sp. SP1S1-7]MDT3335902.1 AAA family ATPase [Shewanella sp. SP1S1-7]
MTKIKAKLALLLEQLNHGLVDREATMKSALLSVLAGENMLLIGPPGTAKSLVARRISKIFNENNQADTTTYFEYLLTKFSTPEEIFGPLSISELKADRFKRNTDGYLPSVKIAFLDEVFKASSSILNALLTIMNERIYHNGTEAVKVPLRTLIAASNELPTGQEELSALYDRFLIRSYVDYISANKLLHFFDLIEEVEIQDPLTQEDLNWLNDTIKNITISAEIRKAILEIWEKHKDTFKEDRREVLSDRRFTKVIKLLRISAATNDRSEVDLSDLLLLKDCLWNHPDNAEKIRKIVLEALKLHNFLGEKKNNQKSIDRKETKKTLPPSNINIIKGYKGCGTESDPLLIHNPDELLGLLRPEIGLKGYYFKQTKDIDCTDFNAWTPISLIGHYDGGLNLVKGNDAALFLEITSSSSVKELTLIGMALTENIKESKVKNCKTNQKMVMNNAISCEFESSESIKNFIGGDARDCHFNTCRAGSSLIGEFADNCFITQCLTGSFLIEQSDDLLTNSIRGCKISDCLILVDYQYNYCESPAKCGLAYTLDGCEVTRCLVTGKLRRPNELGGDWHFNGLADELCCSQITACALGPVEISDNIQINSGIYSSLDYRSIVNSNASIDSVEIYNRKNDLDGKDGRAVSATQFNQYFFEHTLNWDFEQVWQWDEDTNLPFLRKVGINAEILSNSESGSAISNLDLLTIQVKANIWL